MLDIWTIWILRDNQWKILVIILIKPIISPPVIHWQKLTLVQGFINERGFVDMHAITFKYLLKTSYSIFQTCILLIP